MVKIIRRTGVVEEKGETISEFQARQQAKRIERRGLTSSEKSRRDRIKKELVRQKIPELSKFGTKDAPGTAIITRRAGDIEFRVNGGKVAESKRPKGAGIITKPSGERFFQRFIKRGDKIIVENIPFEARARLFKPRQQIIISRISRLKQAPNVKQISGRLFLNTASGTFLDAVTQRNLTNEEVLKMFPFVIRASPVPKTLREKLAKIKSEQLLKIKEAKREVRPTESILRGTFVLGALGVARGLNDFKNLILNPVESAKNLAKFAKELVKNNSIS
jgi:hypothetical protein